MSEREKAVPITEGRCSKGGQNPPNPTTARPPAPGGSGGNTIGRCPICGGKGVLREKRPHGNDRCENGHVYASSQAVTGAPDLQAELAALRAQVERLEELVKLKDELLCCYRIGKRPTERLLNRLAKLAAVLRETEVDTETGRE